MTHHPPDPEAPARRTVLTVFGTRPEVIKLAPVVTQLERRRRAFRTVNVSSGQHPDLIEPFVRLFGLRWTTTSG